MFLSETIKKQCDELSKLTNPNTTLSQAVLSGISIGMKVGTSFSNIKSDLPFSESVYRVVNGVGSLGWLKWKLKAKNNDSPILNYHDLAKNIREGKIYATNDLKIDKFYNRLTGNWKHRDTNETIMSIADAQLSKDEFVLLPTYSRTKGLPELLEMRAYESFNPALTRSAKIFFACCSKFYQDLHNIGVRGNVLDVGTGSGILTILPLYLGWDVTGADIEETAVSQAKENASRHGFPNANYFTSNLFDGLPTDIKYDVITFNPPCISQYYEPTLPGYLKKAIFDPEMETLNRFMDQSRKYLNDGGTILTMISSQATQKSVERWGEPNPVMALANKYGFNKPKLIGSLSRPRGNNSSEIFSCYSIQQK